MNDAPVLAVMVFARDASRRRALLRALASAAPGLHSAPSDREAEGVALDAPGVAPRLQSFAAASLAEAAKCLAASDIRLVIIDGESAADAQALAQRLAEAASTRTPEIAFVGHLTSPSAADRVMVLHSPQREEALHELLQRLQSSRT